MNPKADETLRNLFSGPAGIQFEHNLCGSGLLLGERRFFADYRWQHNDALTAKIMGRVGKAVRSPDADMLL